MRYKRMEKIFKMNQSKLKGYLQKQLVSHYGIENVFNQEKYLLACGETDVMLVAHLDTVFKEVPNLIIFDAQKNIMTSPQGLGADDRAGVISILSIIESGHKPYILFTNDEEIGCIGARDFANDIEDFIELRNKLSEIKYMIELDRTGKDDAVFYDCGNIEFQNYILSFGFKHDFGSFTDITEISPVLDIASVNLSCGYYNAHSKNEYLKLNEMQATIDKVINILNDSENVPQFKFEEVVKKYTKYSKYNYLYDSYYEDNFYSEKEKSSKGKTSITAKSNSKICDVCGSKIDVNFDSYSECYLCSVCQDYFSNDYFTKQEEELNRLESKFNDW